MSLLLIPAIVTSSKEFNYPENPIEKIKERCKNTISVSGDTIAGELGNPRLVNTILIGVLSNCLPFEKQIWVDTIGSKVKERFVEINLKAFDRGRALSSSAVKA